MAHNISIRKDGTAEAAFAKVPWHGLGYIAGKNMPVQDALEKANLNWFVESAPVYFYVEKEERFEIIEDKKAMIREDTKQYLGTVGNRYVPIQNKEQAEFIEALVGEGGVVEAVGALENGRKIFWTIKVPGQLIVGKKDRVDQMLILFNAHDGSKAFTGFWSPIRVVCSNTLNAALRMRNIRDGFSIRHTANAKDRIEHARKTLGLAKQYYENLEAEFAKMYATSFSVSQFSDFLTDLIPVETKDNGQESAQRIHMREQIRSNWSRGIGVDLAGKTAWGAYNAVTLYTSHQRTPNATRGKRFESLLYGSARDLAQKAFELATAANN